MTFEPKTSFEPVRRCTYAASRSFKNSKSKATFKNSQFLLKNWLFLQYFYIDWEIFIGSLESPSRLTHSKNGSCRLAREPRHRLFLPTRDSEPSRRKGLFTTQSIYPLFSNSSLKNTILWFLLGKATQNIICKRLGQIYYGAYILDSRRTLISGYFKRACLGK